MISVLNRMGKTYSLFALVKALDSSRDEQAASYLSALDDPKPLYFFLERVNGNTQVKLLEILAESGDAETLKAIKPYTESYEPRIANAAQCASAAIEQRLGESTVEATTRPRRADPESTAP